MADQNMSGEIIQHVPKDIAAIQTNQPDVATELPPLPSADPKIRFVEESAGLQYKDPEAISSLKKLLKDYTVEGATPQQRGLLPDREAIEKASPEFSYPTEPNERRFLDIAISTASGFYKYETPEDDVTADRLLELLRDPGRRGEGMRELDKALAAKKTRRDS